MMSVRAAPRHILISEDLEMEKKEFFKRKEWRWSDGGAAEPRSAYLFSLLFSCLPPLFLPRTKELCAQLSALPLFCV